MAYEVIKDAPPPSRGINSRYPFAEMEIGDAFDIPITSSRRASQGLPLEQNRVRTASGNYGKKTGKHFLVRRISPNKARCWRIE